MNALTVETLSFAYGRGRHRHPVLNTVGFTADYGEIVCILGENGAGKTTLFRCIMGHLSGDSGAIFLGDTDIRQLSPREIAANIAYIPQAHEPTFNYTVLQTVLMGTTPLLSGLQSPRATHLALAKKALAMVNIDHLSHRGYAQLSGGERQLTLIARALAQQSKILIMDEPTATLDFGNQYRVLQTVRSLAEQGYLVLLSTHTPEHALRFGHTVLILQEGTVQAYGPPKEVLTAQRIHELYGIPVEIPHISLNGDSVPVVVPRLDCFQKQKKE